MELNARVLAQLNYIPSVEGGAEATRTAASAMQKAGILDASTDLNALVDRTFVRLPTLDDSWVRSVKVEKEDKISCQQIRARTLHNINPNEIFVFRIPQLLLPRYYYSAGTSEGIRP